MAMVGQNRSVGAVARPTVLVPCYIEVGNGRAVIHVHPRWDEAMRKGMYAQEYVQVIVLPDPAVQLNGAMVGELEPGDETPVKTFEEKQREARQADELPRPGEKPAGDDGEGRQCGGDRPCERRHQLRQRRLNRLQRAPAGLRLRTHHAQEK